MILAATIKSHPALHNEIYHECRLDTRTDDTYQAGGYLDGPLAYDMLLESLQPPPEGRTDADIQLYDDALALMTKEKLHDWCLPAEYMKRSQRLITVLFPFI